MGSPQERGEILMGLPPEPKRVPFQHKHSWQLAKFTPNVKLAHPLLIDGSISIWVCECGALKEVKHNE